MIVAEGHSILTTCRVRRVSESGFYAQRSQPPLARALWHAYLIEFIGRIHLDSRGSYGARRVHAEPTLGHGLEVGRCAVDLLMVRAGLAGLSGQPQFRRIVGWSIDASPTAALVTSALGMAIELLGRRHWRTRVELANAMFEYLEIFHNRQRRHSALRILIPIEFETRHRSATVT